MEKENYLISQTGFGGTLFRVTERYQNEGEKPAKSADTIICNGQTISTFTKYNRQGTLIRYKARPTETTPSSPKTRLAVFKPADEENFKQYLQTRQPKTGPINIEEIPSVADPLNLIQSLSQSAKEAMPETTCALFLQSINRLSLSSTQNPEELRLKINERLTAGLPVRIGCFVCLDIKCVNVSNRPAYYIGQDETRLESPKLMRRTEKIMRALENTNIPFFWDFLLADTDAKEIYGEWLKDSDCQQSIAKFLAKIKRTLGFSGKIRCRCWSEIQKPNQVQYERDFNQVINNIDLYVDEIALAESIRRRSNYFTSLGLSGNAEIDMICATTGKRNFALYAAQGPIINQEYDILVIADPDPTRLGQKQSLLCPQLPIWYPYPG